MTPIGAPGWVEGSVGATFPLGHEMTTRRFEKQVAIKATDSAEQRATGVVLTPWAVDTQRDFLRPAGIKNLHTTRPKNGVMHAAFPDGAAEVVRSEVLESSTTIDGAAFDAGEWVITREYNDDELWSLVDDGVLNGFSIGGRITEDKTYSEGEIPERVTFPAGVEPGSATEIRDGSVDEVSDVDIPAVPAAEYAAVKANDHRVGKTAYQEAAGREEFIEMMADRGHSEADAGRLYDYIDGHADKMAGASGGSMSNDTNTNDSDDDPDDATKWRKFKSWLTGPDDGMDEADAAASVAVPEVPVGGDVEAALSKAAAAHKEGRSLNTQNREALMAAHDAVEAALSSDLDFETNRFTDDPFTEFDVADYEKAADTSASDMTESTEDPPEWAKGLTETVEQIEKRVDTLESEDEDAEKNGGDGDGTEKGERPEWADDLVEKFNEKVDEIEERVDAISKSTAGSGQLGQPVGSEEADSEKRAAIEKEREVFTR